MLSEDLVGFPDSSQGAVQSPFEDSNLSNSPIQAPILSLDWKALEGVLERNHPGIQQQERVPWNLHECDV